MCSYKINFVCVCINIEEERATRRISYLKATAWGDRMSVDDLSTTVESESEPLSIVVEQQK